MVASFKFETGGTNGVAKKNRRVAAVGSGGSARFAAFRPLDRRSSVRRKSTQSKNALKPWG
jgi:ATP-dependent protease HslVU (ClpYQ) peptidase subunit